MRYMRNILVLFFVTPVMILTCFTSAWAGTSQGLKETTTVVIHCNYAPVTFWDKNIDKPSGFAVDIIDSVARLAGLRVNYICKNGWPEMITSIENGEADISVLLKSEEREKILLFSSPIAVTYLSYFGRSQSTMNPDSIPMGHTVGVIRGSRSYEQLKDRPGTKLSVQDNYQEGIFSLLAGQIDLFAGEESLILKQAREARLEDHIKRIGKPFSEQERGLVVRKGNIRLLEMLDTKVKDFVGGPEYQDIYQKWYGMPTPYWTAGKILLISGLFLLIAVFGMAYWRYKSIFRINRELVRTIDERKRTEESLRESEDKFRSIFEQAIDGIMIADAETKRHIEANKAICDMLGYARDEIIGLSVDDMHPKEDLPAVRDIFEKQVRDEISLAPEVPMLRKDGSVFYADINATRVTLGGKHCLVGIFRDITKRKQAETVLKTREKQLAESQRIAQVGSWEHNIETGQVFWSDELFRLLGIDPKTEKADFQRFFEMVHPDDRESLKKAIEDTVQLHKPLGLDYRFILKDGTEKILNAQAELHHDNRGENVILSGTVQDITERKLVEDKIRRSERFIRSILDTVDEGFIVIDPDHRILTANNAYCSQVSLSCDAVIGRRCYEVSHKRERPCYEEGEECAVRRVFATGEPHSALHKHADGDGHVLYVETKGFPIKDDSGHVTSVIETVNNITEKHLLEEERLKSQKLEAIGTLAGGIAHDFNNLLQGVFGYISLARLKREDREKSLAALEEAEKALHLSVRLTNQLLTFSKGGKPVKKRIDLRPVIENAAKFALSGSRSGCRIVVDDGRCQAEADEGQISQVIQNIVLNADQSMPEGGQVEIAVKNVQAPDKALPQGLRKGSYVAIAIKDNGVGISEQYLSKIFDPYFTTKEKGSGLGLATSYSIIKNHNGLIDVTSEKDKGSTFIIYVPAVPAERPQEHVKPAAKETPGRAGRVLVMDDERVVCDVAGELIKALGHEVEFAAHGKEAIDKYQKAPQSGKPFDVVILDLTIRGGMGGAETMRRLMEIDPAVKAVVSSGYSDDTVTSNYDELGFKAFLKKPYNVDDLRAVLDDILSA
jgi:PAS domain S-box-containing protein